MYLFISGRGRLLRVDADGIERRGADVEPSEYVGEKSLFLHEERQHSLVIVRDATVLVLPKRDLDEIIRRYPAIKSRLNIRDDVRNVAMDHDFPWLEPGEVVLRYTRRHKWAFWRRAFLSIPLLVILLPVPLLISLLPIPFLSGLFVGMGFLPMLIFPALVVFYTWRDWQNDWFVITNQRVVHEEHVLLTFAETREQAPLHSIQAVRTSVEGYWAEQLGFGDLILSTAGAGGTLVFDMIEDPEDLADVINKELRRTSAHKAAESRDQIRQEIDNFLGMRALNRTRSEDLPQPGRPTTPPTPPTGVRSRLEQYRDRVAAYFDIRVRIDEGFRVTYRKHWLVLWNDIFAPSFAMVLTFVLLVSNIVWHSAWPWVLIYPLLRILGFVLVFGFLGLWWWYMYEDWHNDLYIIEAQTLKRVHRRPLWLQDEQSTIMLRNIQGVNVSVTGIWQKLLNYGTVIVQTAAEDSAGDGATGEIELNYVHHPHALQEDILRRQRREETENGQSNTDQVAKQIARWLAVYHQATHPEDFDTTYMQDLLDKGSVNDSYSSYDD